MRPLLALVLFASLGAQACAATPGDRIREGAGAVSQTLCSETFVSGLDPQAAYREHPAPEPGMNLIGWALRYTVDRERREVVTRVLGMERRAVFAEGRGCTLMDQGVPAPIARAPHAAALLAPIAGPEIVTPASPRLVAALDAAFAEPARGAPRRTKAVVLVQHGVVVAERYAPDVGPDTPLLAHSMSKSMMNAMAGVLVREGKLSVQEPVAAPEWAGPNDPRDAITVDNLLRMNSGMGFDEGAGSSIATQIWYNEPDTAAAAARSVRLASPPGRAWGYSSRSYVLLSRILEQRAGGSPQAFVDLAQREILDPLGMHSFVFEFDAAGTPMGANATFATPRDWARFGLLYLNDGVVGGRRILPEGWVRASTTPSSGAGYGAGFWLNSVVGDIPVWGGRWGFPGAPADAYAARGYMGQYVVIVPSADLVVVRMGQSHARNGDIESVANLVRDVVAALRQI